MRALRRVDETEELEELEVSPQASQELGELVRAARFVIDVHRTYPAGSLVVGITVRRLEIAVDKYIRAEHTESRRTSLAILSFGAVLVVVVALALFGLAAAYGGAS